MMQIRDSLFAHPTQTCAMHGIAWRREAKKGTQKMKKIMKSVMQIREKMTNMRYENEKNMNKDVIHNLER